MNRFRKNLLDRLKKKIRAFAIATQAVAVVEFALIFPFVLALYIGAVETSMIVSLDRRLANVAGSMGDLVSRNDGNVTSAELSDYFSAASLVLAPYDDANLLQVITCLRLEADDTATVVWSVGNNGGTARAVDSSFTLPTELTSIIGDSYVIIAEAEMTYLPLGGIVIEAPVTLYKQFYYLPRFGELIDLI